MVDSIIAAIKSELLCYFGWVVGIIFSLVLLFLTVQPASANSLRRHVAASLMKYHRSIDRNNCSLQPVTPTSYGSSMEVMPSIYYLLNLLLLIFLPGFHCDLQMELYIRFLQNIHYQSPLSVELYTKNCSGFPLIRRDMNYLRAHTRKIRRENSK